jgi:hypothetical protein
MCAGAGPATGRSVLWTAADRGRPDLRSRASKMLSPETKSSFHGRERGREGGKEKERGTEGERGEGKGWRVGGWVGGRLGGRHLCQVRGRLISTKENRWLNNLRTGAPARASRALCAR